MAPDKFRGTATADEVAEALARGARAANFEVATVPLADGGEGTLDALGGVNRSSSVSGPLGHPVEASWRLDSAGTAIIEAARVSGLALVGGAAHNDPIRANTRGTGTLINEALSNGAKKIIVTVGGSATTDGGRGAVDVIDLRRLSGAELIVATDVRALFLDAAKVFGPQKGASADQVNELTKRLEQEARYYLQRFGIDVRRVVGSGAAGGLAGGLCAIGARIVDGFALVAAHVGLVDQLKASDIVLTGEGCVDQSSLDGKVVGGVLALAQELGVRAGIVAGRIDYPVPGIPTISLVEAFGEKQAFTDTLGSIERGAETLLTRMRPSR